MWVSYHIHCLLYVLILGHTEPHLSPPVNPKFHSNQTTQNAHNDAAGAKHALVDMSTIELKAEDLVGVSPLSVTYIWMSYSTHHSNPYSRTFPSLPCTLPSLPKIPISLVQWVASLHFILIFSVRQR